MRCRRGPLPAACLPSPSLQLGSPLHLPYSPRRCRALTAPLDTHSQELYAVAVLNLPFVLTGPESEPLLTVRRGHGPNSRPGLTAATARSPRPVTGQSLPRGQRPHWRLPRAPAAPSPAAHALPWRAPARAGARRRARRARERAARLAAGAADGGAGGVQGGRRAALIDDDRGAAAARPAPLVEDAAPPPSEDGARLPQAAPRDETFPRSHRQAAGSRTTTRSSSSASTSCASSRCAPRACSPPSLRWWRRTRPRCKTRAASSYTSMRLPPGRPPS